LSKQTATRRLQAVVKAAVSVARLKLDAEAVAEIITEIAEAELQRHREAGSLPPHDGVMAGRPASAEVSLR
jgi:hypothetical protein